MVTSMRWTSVGLLAVCVCGCSSDWVDEMAGAGCQALPEPHFESGDVRFQDLASAIPEFAGYYLLPDGTVQVNLTNAASGPSYEDTLREHVANVEDWSGTLVFGEVAYSYDSLLHWKAVFFAAEGLTGLSVDVVRNQVLVTVPDENAGAEIVRIRDCRAVPSSAVAIIYGHSGQD